MQVKAIPYPIVFVDMKEREADERRRLENRVFELEQHKAKEATGKLAPDLERELQRMKDKLYLPEDPARPGERLPNPKVCDPLFVKLREALAKICPDMVCAEENKAEYVGDHVDGKLPTQRADTENEPLTEHEKAFAAVYGILLLDGKSNPAHKDFFSAVSVAQGEYAESKELFHKVLDILAPEGKLFAPIEYHVRTRYWVAVARILRAERVSDELLSLRAKSALAKVDGVTDGAPSSSLNIDLPDLEEQADIEIVVDNLHAMQAIYFAASLEELKLFQVVDKLVELFHKGYLPLGKGSAGDELYRYWKESQNRLTEVERRSLYARAFGFPGGETAQNQPNREFDILWLRFLSSVASYVRQLQVDDLLRSNVPMTVSQEHVRKSGRDLAANLSLHGYGIAWFAATELQGQINDIIRLLSDPEIKLAYGARDMWQVIDQVSTMELGGARNSIRYRTMANSGAIVIRWLAKRSKELAGAALVDVLDVSAIKSPIPRPAGTKPTVDPSDYDLFNACEQWLAVNGVRGQDVESYAQPSEPPMTTSRPIQVPSLIKEELESVGVPPGIVGGNGNGAAVPDVI